MNWSLAQLAAATDGQLLSEADRQITFKAVSTDSRSLTAGDLYVALQGERFDGHDFLAQAIEQGAAAVLVAKPVQADIPTLLVQDTRLALGQFAAWHRQQMPLKSVIGITGSNGKTTTKTLLAHLLTSQAATWATQGNLNNDFGVPRTLLQIEPSHAYAVIEMGANHLDEIRYLTQLVKPNIALITNAAGAHLEGFGSLEGVIEAKGEIFEGLAADGTAILNRDSAGYAAWQAKCNALGVTQLTFGEQEQADVRLTDYLMTARGSEFTLCYQGQTVALQMSLVGRHNALNAAAVIAICLKLGMDWQAIQTALLSFDGVKGRLQQYALPKGWLLDDSYNANPESMRAGIRTVMALGGEVALCLGGMAELGADSEQAHCALAHFAREQGVSRLLLCGEATKPMVIAFGDGAHWFATQAELVAAVNDLIRQEVVQHLLVKGSRSAGMEGVTEGVLQAFI